MPYWRAFLILLAIAAPAAVIAQGEDGARTERVRALAETPRGGWAHGSVGDYVMRSGSVHAVIGGFPSEADADSVAPFRFGALLDIVPNLRQTDGLGYLLPGVADSTGEIDLGEEAITFSSGRGVTPARW